MIMHAWRFPAASLGLAALFMLAGCAQPLSSPVVAPEQTAPLAVASSEQDYSVQQGPWRRPRISYRYCQVQLNRCLYRANRLPGPFRIRTTNNCLREYRFCTRYAGRWRRGASVSEGAE